MLSWRAACSSCSVSWCPAPPTLARCAACQHAHQAWEVSCALHRAGCIPKPHSQRQCMPCRHECLSAMISKLSGCRKRRSWPSRRPCCSCSTTTRPWCWQPTPCVQACWSAPARCCLTYLLHRHARALATLLAAHRLLPQDLLHHLCQLMLDPLLCLGRESRCLECSVGVCKPHGTLVTRAVCA